MIVGPRYTSRSEAVSGHSFSQNYGALSLYALDPLEIQRSLN